MCKTPSLARVLVVPYLQEQLRREGAENVLRILQLTFCIVFIDYINRSDYLSRNLIHTQLTRRNQKKRREKLSSFSSSQKRTPSPSLSISIFLILLDNQYLFKIKNRCTNRRSFQCISSCQKQFVKVNISEVEDNR